MQRRFPIVCMVVLLAIGLSSDSVSQLSEVDQQVISLNEAAARFNKLGKLDSAWIAADSAVRLSESDLGVDHPMTALSMNSLATLMHDWGRIEKADSLYRRIFRIWSVNPPADSTVFGAALYNYGTIQMERRRPKEAVQTLSQAAVVIESAMGPSDQHLGDALYLLAEAYRATKDCISAIPLYRRAVEIRDAIAGPANLPVAQALNSLGICLVGVDSLNAAERVYQRALTIVEQAHGPHDLASAYCMDNLTRLYLRQKRYAEAQRLSSLSLEIFRSGPGNESAEVAQALTLRGDILLGSGQYEAAVPVLREAEILLVQLAGPGHPAVRDVRRSLGRAYEAMGDTVSARGLGNEAVASPSDSN